MKMGHAILVHQSLLTTPECASARLFVVSQAKLLAVSRTVAEYIASVTVPAMPDGLPSLPFPQVALVMDRSLSLGTGQGMLHGYHLDAKNSVVHAVATHPNGEHVLLPVYQDGTWRGPAQAGEVGMMLHVVFDMIDRGAVVQNRQRVPDRLRRQLEVRRDRTAPGAPVPRDFYPIDVRARSRWVGETRRSLVRIGRAWTVKHRHDVRGHLRVLTVVGKREPTAKRRRDLERRGYTLASPAIGPLPDDLAQLTQGRTRMPAEGWIAIKAVRVRPHVRGSSALPYVPAAWRVDVDVRSELGT